MTFLTVEDVNSVNLNHINEYYELDTSKISEQEFSGVLYDFCIVGHSINGSYHIFTLEVHNSLWKGGYYVEQANVSYDSSTNTLTVVTNKSSIVFYLILSNYASFSLAKHLAVPFESFMLITKKEIGTTKKVKYIDLQHNKNIIEYNRTLNLGVNSGLTNVPLLVLLKKTDLVYNLSDDLTVGIVNQIQLDVDDDYLPGGSLVDEDLLDIVIKYEDIEIPVVYDSELNDYYFNLDLTKKIDNKPIKLEVIVNEIDLVNASRQNITLSCSYSSASNYEELQRNIVAGAEIIELTNDITFNSNLIIPHNLMIYAKNHNIYLGSYNINVLEGISVEMDDGNFFNGTNCFIQQVNSKLVLNNCKFSNAIISDNFKGSVISADYDGLDDTIITELVNCRFVNCHHTIYHGGDLTVKDCKALFDNFNENVDTDYPAFLTAYDGTVELIGSIFDIDYNNDDNPNIKFAEALIGLGENTIFNGFATNQLKYNDILPFFDAPFNNKSHIFVKYFYPQINAYVISSPILGKEDRSVCHMILGTDWVYKNNVQVTRVDWQSENNIRKIDWSEI